MELTTRQHQIIDAAGKLFTNSGLNGLTVKNLAHEMHFAESALYRHFKNKEEIIVIMLEYLADNIDKRLSNIPHTGKPEEDLRNLFREQLRFFKENPHFVVTVFSDGLMGENQIINKAILNLIETKMKHLVPIIKQGQETGLFTSQISSDQLSDIIMGTFKLQMLKWRITNFSYNIQETGEKMITSLLTLIKNT